MTPSKRRKVPPVAGDDFTDVTTPPAPEGPWDSDDPDSESHSADEESRYTQPTAVVQAKATSAPVPTPTRTQQTATSRDDFDLAPGTKLGEYRIEAKIGQGGMGVVFSAVHPLIGKRAAIKILKKELCADPFTLERFIDEARVVNQIGHPNIVDVFAFGEMPDGRSYFVMEWLKGETLRERIARAPLTLTEVVAIVRPLARALQAAHDKGVIHRDLKPDNVYLVDVGDDQPAVKLLDFGIAKLASNEHRVERTATGAIVGTPQYIAPEQAKGYTIDHRADIYALGAIVFELLTRRPPFVADNAMEMVAKHLMETPLPPSHFADGVPNGFDELVMRMLAKTPEGRPSLSEVVKGLTADPSAPVRAVSEPSAPIPRLESAPVGIPQTPGPIRSVPAVSQQPFSAQVLQQSDVVAAKRPKAMWLAIAGVPIAGVLAFLLVSSLGSDPKLDPAPRPVAGEPAQVEPIVAPDPTPPTAGSAAVVTPVEPDPPTPDIVVDPPPKVDPPKQVDPPAPATAPKHTVTTPKHTVTRPKAERPKPKADPPKPKADPPKPKIVPPKPNPPKPTQPDPDEGMELIKPGSIKAK